MGAPKPDASRNKPTSESLEQVDVQPAAAEGGGVTGLRRHRAIASLFAVALVLVVSVVAGTLVGIVVFVLYLLLLTARRPRT
jgi:Flp pilus assembly protein TadB